jgi:hypothetical protein
MLRPNLLFQSWRELPTSILALHFTEPDQPVTQIDDLIDFKDPQDRGRLIQFLSIFGWTLHDSFMTSIPCFHLDRSIGKMLSLNVSAANAKIIGYQPVEQEEFSLAALKREIDLLKRSIGRTADFDQLLAKQKERYSKLISDAKSPQARVTLDSAPTKHHQPWTSSEDAQLKEEFESGQNIKDIAATHNRSQLAIQSRLLKLQLVPTV